MRRIAAVAALLLVAVAVWAPAASAHTEIVGTSPANGERLGAAPDEIRVEFSQGARLRSGEATVTGPEGTTLSTGKVRVDGAHLVIPMPSTAGNGRYVADFRAMSSDGHAVSGSISFEVTPAPSPAPSSSAGTDPSAPDTKTPTPDTGETAAATGDGRNAGTPARDGDADPPARWPWLAAGLALVGAAVALAVRLFRHAR